MKSNNQDKKGRIYSKSFLSILVLFLMTFSFNCVWADSGSYIDTVQKIFIGYYQRPADPAGLLYWAARLDARAGNLNEIIEAFANSAESQALYGAITSSNISTVVNSIYNALFGRSAEAEGLNYYVNGFNSGQFTAATIMLNVLYGAQNEDLQSVNNKVTAANLFTRTIDPELDGADFQATYSGDADAQKARDSLSTITSNPATIPTQAEIAAYIQDDIADSGDPILSAITAGAFNYKGNYPSPGPITYTDISGQSMQVLAYPGQVQLFVNPTTSTPTITSLVQTNGGTIIGQIPSFGYYLISVTAGEENAFITSVNANANVKFAIPNSLIQKTDVVDLSTLEGPNGELPTVPNLKAQVGDGVYLYVPDDYVNASMTCGTSLIAHGNGTDYVASRNLSGTGQQMNIFAIAGTTVRPNDVASANAITLQDMTFNATGRAVVNLSLQGAYEDVNHNPLTAAQYRANERNLLWNYAAQLNALAQVSPGSFNQTVFIISAGNGVGNMGSSGLDLTSEIQQLHAAFPLVFPSGQGPHMIIVGGTQQNSTAVDTGFNYSTINGDIVYAPARHVQVSASGCTADGTSFAAPAVANLIASVLAANPNSTVGQVTLAFMNAYRNKGYVLPTVNDINSQLAGACTYSILPTSQSFDSTGGNGSVNVTAPSSCSWTALSNSPNFITITSGSSGTGNGTVAFSVSANASTNQRTGTMTIAAQTFTVTQAGAQGVTGTWDGTLNLPGAGYTGCYAETIPFSLTLNEDINNNITGSTSNNRTITSGSRSGNSITVTLNTWWGSRGPYIWTWNGTNTITGSMAYFCYDVSTLAILSEGIETFSVTRSD